MDPTADSPVESSSSGASVVTSAAAEEPAGGAAEPPYPLDDLEVKLRAHLVTVDVTSTTLKEIRKQVSARGESESERSTGGCRGGDTKFLVCTFYSFTPFLNFVSRRSCVSTTT
jgi:hypothetical protein